jgi:ADP-L-glycero-D-manno-heptose 6-epimerase
MKSVVAQKLPLAVAGQPVTLFKSYRPDVADGGQRRDFVYVRDCANVVLWLLDNPQVNGLFNLGTGIDRSFEDLANAVFAALGKTPKISFIDMPESIRGHYQYFTRARMDRLRAAGFDEPLTTLEDGVRAYVQGFLLKPDPYR